MNEFTSEYLATLRRLLENSPYKQIKIQSNLFKKVIDEIERLQKENDLLQTNRMCLNRDLAKAEKRIAEMDARISAYETDDPYLAIRYQPLQEQE